MALDPKYADLPWIAHGQPDVYEAGELPEVDQRALRVSLFYDVEFILKDDTDDGMAPKEIESIRLSVSDAHKRFASCKLDSSKVDFSDSIAGPGKMGYTIVTDEYEVETLMSRLQRLQTEVAQLVNDASAVSDQTKINQKNTVHPVELAQLVESLREQLKQIELKDLNVVDTSTTGEEKVLFSKLVGQLEAFKPDSQDSRQPASSTHLVYEIYDRPDLSKHADLEKIGDLDRRIQRLEALIGQPDPSKLSALTADTAQLSLMEAATRLSARTALLQPNHLDMIETRLSALQTKLQTITEKRETISDADTQNKVAELYELVKKWDDVVDSLPMIVERLSELKSLHEEASEFSNALSALELSQKSVEENLSTYTKLLDSVDKNLKENMQTVQKNFASLESRLS
ncbi:Dynactin subunit 2-B [Paragonimus heterotremus]|uniref:Dynactin subunit 2-B n=1 Tax=Paragonimus heterotremus TaxID=100268 RepID=A0A8J4SY92_9TREM|nr:Dynactin subunit 2-B [Paragonimus heterotremus]